MLPIYLITTLFPLVLALPPSPTQAPLQAFRPLYHYCLPTSGASTPHAHATSLTSTFCISLSRTYQPNVYGEVEEHYEDGLVMRAWWDASEVDKEEVQKQCVEAVERVILGCEMIGGEGRVYGGTSEFKGVGGRVDILPGGDE